MKVLHVTLSFSRGGRRNAITSLVRGLRGLGVEGGLCCLNELGCLPEEITALGIHVEVLRRNSLLDWAALGKFRRVCSEMEFDVVHTHDAASQFTAALALLGMPHIPLLMTFHRSISMESATLADRLRNSLASSQCGAIVTGSLERREHFLSQNLVSPRKVVRIPFGIDLARFEPDPQSREAVRRELGFGTEVTLIGSIGHFGPEKGIDLAIRAFQALQTRSLREQVGLVIFGEGSHRAELERLAGDQRICFAGFRSDIDRYMQGLDVLLHAPRQEAFGLVVIEAMATGLPVVASRVGGIPELVREGSTGFLAQPENPESFAQALELLVNNRSLRNRMAQEAHRIASAEYGSDLFARRHRDLYESLLARRSPGSLMNGREPAAAHRNASSIVQHTKLDGPEPTDNKDKKCGGNCDSHPSIIVS